MVDALPRAASFDTACAVVVAYLQSALPMGMWAVTRVIEDRQLMLLVEPPEYDLQVGTELTFATSLCSRIPVGGAPLVVPDIRADPGFADFIDTEGVAVRAYTGAVITAPNGAMFGTVCGWSPRPQPSLTDDASSLLRVLTTLLSSLLAADLALTASHRDIERAQLLSDTDEMTRLLNRRGWNRFLDMEESRRLRFGDPAGMVVLDLDGLKQLNDTSGHHAGDLMLRSTAAVLTAQTRATDVVARLGGDEFGIIAVGATHAQIDALVVRLQRALSAAGIPASMGAVPITLRRDYHQAWKEADALMYEDKRRHQLARMTQHHHITDNDDSGSPRQ